MIYCRCSIHKHIVQNESTRGKTKIILLTLEMARQEVSRTTHIEEGELRVTHENAILTNITDMDADHTALLYQTQVRWLSKGNMLSRIFELREEVKLFLVEKQKHDLLLAFGGDGFSTYLAYLADIFEALNQLNKKLQGPGTNIL